MTSEPEDQRERKFYPYRRATQSSLKQYTANVAADLLRVMSRGKRHKPEYLQMFRAIVEAVVCDLVACALSDDPALIISLSDGKKKGASTKRYYSGLERSKQFRRTIEALGERGLGLVVFDKEAPWMPKPGLTLRASTIRPSAALFAAISKHGWSFESMEHVQPNGSRELIVLKREKDPDNAYWDTAEAIGYADNETTRALRERMGAVNGALARLNLQMVKDSSSGYQADLGDRELRRIFLLGSTEFDRGGRLAGGFWSNMPGEERWRLRINGEPIIVLDYGQLNLSLCYARKRSEMPTGDAYDILGALKLSDAETLGEKLSREQLWEKVGRVQRGQWKKLSNALLFVKGPKKRFPKSIPVEAMAGLTVSEAASALKGAHEDIRDCFETEFGYELQWHESNILMEVLKRCPYALPLHDAIMVPMSKVRLALDAMRHAFENYTATTKELGHRIGARISVDFPLLDYVATTHMAGTTFEIPQGTQIKVTGGGRGESRRIELSRGIAVECPDARWLATALPAYVETVVLPNPLVRFKPESVHGAKSRKGEWIAIDFGYIELPGKTPKGVEDFNRVRLMVCVAVSGPKVSKPVVQALSVLASAKTPPKARAQADEDLRHMFNGFLAQFGYSKRNMLPEGEIREITDAEGEAWATRFDRGFKGKLGRVRFPTGLMVRSAIGLSKGKPWRGK